MPMPESVSPPPRRRTRLTPEARRQQIVDAARGLFAERPFAQISVADVADAAGCSRPTVHAYFGTMANLFFATLSQAATSHVEVRDVSAPTPLRKRLAANTAAAIDMVDANPELYWAMAGHKHTTGSAQIDALHDTITEAQVQRSLDNNHDVAHDTPATRAAIHALWHFNREATRRYLAGELSRKQMETLAFEISHALYKTAIPKIERLDEGG